MDKKRVLTGMYLEYPDGTQNQIFKWNIYEYDHQTITTLELQDGSELKIVSENVKAELMEEKVEIIDSRRNGR